MLVSSAFNPFEKPFKEVNAEDIHKLSTVAEGLFIEYKQSTPAATKIAKSIASFANSHGGVLFLGIVADIKTNLPKEFPGVELAANYIHDAVRDSVSPFPEFENYLVNLTSGKSIVMVVVPEGLDAPYIHADGRVYRRQQSSSDPVIENNRFTIDELYSRKIVLKKVLDNFRSTDYGFTKAEDDQPFLITYINATPFNSFMFKDFFTTNRLESVRKHFTDAFIVEETINGESSTTMTGVMKMDQIMFYENSISLRYLSQQNLAYHSLTIELYSNGNIKILQPLQTIGNTDQSDGRFVDLLSMLQIIVEYPVKYIPMNSVSMPLLGILQRYLALMTIEGYTGRIEFTFETRNCYRTIIYSKADSYRSYVRRFGIPLCMKPSQIFPKAPNKVLISELLKSPAFSLLEIMTYVLIAFGLPNPDSLSIAIEDLHLNQKAV